LYEQNPDKMSFQTFVTERLADLTAKYNALVINAKKIDELPVQTTLDPASKIHVSKDGNSESLSVQKIVDTIVKKTYSHLLEVGEITVTGLVVNVPSGVKWVYDGIYYQTTSETNITETLCETDHLRKDILVANQSNQIYLIKGDESLTIRVLPNVPIGTILVTEMDIDDTTVGTPYPSITIQDLESKLEKSTYPGTAKTLNDAILALAFPDTVLKTGEITVDGLDISIAENAFQWRLAQTDFLTTPAFSATLTAATEGFNRTDRLEGDNAGNYFIVEGTEDETAAPAPAVTAGRISLATIPIFGSVVGIAQTAFPNEIETPFTVIDRANRKGTSIWSFCMSFWKWVGSTPVYINTFIDNVTERYDVQYPNKTGGLPQTFAMISDVEASATTLQGNIDTKLDITDYNQHFKGVHLTKAALDAAHPTANAGDSAQVNEVGSTDVVNYSWDVEESIWVNNGTGGSGAINTDYLLEGSTNLYWTVARFLANLTAANIKSALGITVLAGDNTGDQIIPTTLPASDVYAWAKAATKPNYTSSEVGAPSGSGTSSGTNTGDQDLSGLSLKPIQVTAQTLTAASWALVSGIYEYDLSNANITITSIVDVIPDNSYVTTVQVAEVFPKTISGSGTVKLYAKNLPTGNIIVTINIWK